MLTLFDHLSATIVAMLLMLTFAAHSARNTQANIEAMRFYASRTQGKAVIETIKGDFVNIGAGTTTRAGVVQAPTNEGGNTVRFAFTGDVNPHEPGTEQVVYTLHAGSGGCRTMQGREGGGGASVPCWRMNRTEDGEAAGGSTGSVLRFKVTLYNGNAVAATADAATEVKVELVMLSPHGQEREIPKLRWASRFRPLNLSRS